MTEKSTLWTGLVCLLGVLWASGVSAERRALLIGISDYSGSAAAEPDVAGRWPAGTQDEPRRWRSLRGAASDAQAMRSMLIETYRLDQRDISVLLDGQATRSAIRQAITALTERSGPGDEVLFYFSGHGSQVRSAASSEADGLDETLVPADARHGAADLRDKELRRLLNRLLDREVALTVILDSCHSGSGVRGDPGWTAPRALAPVIVPHWENIDAGPPLVDRGALVMAASLDRAEAFERCEADDCFGVFTRALLEAMSLASPEATVGDLFRRTRARLRLYNQVQEPTLLGTSEAKQRALFGGRRDQVQGVAVVAVERVRDDGRIVLQAGWVNGLTVGSELVAPDGGGIVRISALDGLDRAIAERVPSVQIRGPVKSTTLHPGTLLTLSAWAPPPGEVLRVWIPPAAVDDTALKLGIQLQALAKEGSWTLIEDPTSPSPTHVLDFRGMEWMLANPEGGLEGLGSTPEAIEIVARLPPDARLYLRLPPSVDLSRKVRQRLGRNSSAIDVVDLPEDAHYILASSLAGEVPRYGWLHRSVFGPRGAFGDLPSRSDWAGGAEAHVVNRGVAPRTEAAVKLARSALVLARILGWLTLSSPAGATPFPYRLALVERVSAASAGSIGVDDRLLGGRLSPGTRYSAMLWGEDADLEEVRASRFVYVFTVDSFGQSVLLFPRDGNVENRFPRVANDARSPPASVKLDVAGFDIVEPFGRDIYVLFTSSELIQDVGVFEWDGARTRGVASNALERLIKRTASGRRDESYEAIPAQWSIERLVFETVQLEVESKTWTLHQF